MELNPYLFAVITYGIAIVIALCVACIIKIIALSVRGRGKNTATTGAEKNT